MAKPPRPWTVTRHDPLTQIEDNLWVVSGDVPGFPAGVEFNRRMSIRVGILIPWRTYL